MRSICAVCHGAAGKGDGQLADSLRMKASDLTVLAKKNRGTLPKDQVLGHSGRAKAGKGPRWSGHAGMGDAF